MSTIVARSGPAVYTAPGGRYDEDGNLYIDLGTDLLDSPLLPFARFALTEGLPDDTFDCDPFADMLWIRFDHARAVERRLRRMWPGAVVTAEANPAYNGPVVAR
jgi:hypothetical protein